MEDEKKEVKKRRGGLEFLPLPAGHDEHDYEVPRGRPHPGQLSLVGELLETVKPDGKRKGRG
jgi:hypothetical protein